jgi:hypothetical protein
LKKKWITPTSFSVPINAPLHVCLSTKLKLVQKLNIYFSNTIDDQTWNWQCQALDCDGTLSKAMQTYTQKVDELIFECDAPSGVMIKSL